MTNTMTPSRRDWLRWISLALAGAGALDSIYLTYIKLAHARAAFCTVGGGCDIVNSSAYSEIGGIPIAVFGLALYLALLALLALENRVGLFREYSRLAVFGLALTGTLYSAYLTYLELYVIHAICPYCVVSAVIVTVILVLSIIRVVQINPAAEAE